jgi:lipopolysaccharide export system permease protein
VEARLSLIDRYVGAAVIRAVAAVLFVLLGLFALFEAIAELENLGPGEYGVGAALVYVLLRLPRLCYELFPSAAIIGMLLALGALARGGELAVIRAAGVSKLKLVGSVLKSGIVFVIAATVLGELIAPRTEQFAHAYRSTKRIGQISLGTQTGIWVRDGNTYINIREVLPGDVIRNVYIHEFDNAHRLRASTYAPQARFADGKWLLEKMVQTRIGPDGVSRGEAARASWESLLRPELIDVVTARYSDRLSVWALYRFVRYLEANGLDARAYRYAMWVKYMYPLATGVMVFLAIPLVLGRLTRSAGAGRGVFIGTLIGLGFHIVNQTAGHLGVVAQVPPWLSAILPTLVILLLAGWLLRRVP